MNGMSGYSGPYPLDYDKVGDYSKCLKHAYAHHAKMISKGWLDSDGGHTVDHTIDTPDEFGYWQSRLTKNDVAKHYASVVFAIHKTHNGTYGSTGDWNLSDADMKKAQASLAGGDAHLPNIKRFAQGFAQKLSSQGKNFDSSAIGSSTVDGDEHMKDRNSEIYQHIKEQFEAEQEYHERIHELYREHMDLSKDPNTVFAPDDTQRKMTRTPRGHHYAACVYAIQRAHHESEFKNVPSEVKKQAQIALAGSHEHLLNIKAFAAKFQKDAGSQSALEGFNPIKPEIFHTEDTMTLRDLINVKLALLSENYEEWFNRSARDAAAGAERLRREKEATGLSHTADLRYKHPDTDGFGYQGGVKKKAETGGTVASPKRALHSFVIWSSKGAGSMPVIEDYANGAQGIGVATERFHHVVTDHVNRIHGSRIFTLTALSGPDHGDPATNRDKFMDDIRKTKFSGSSNYAMHVRAHGDLLHDHESGYMPIDMVHIDTSDPTFPDYKVAPTYEEGKKYLGLGKHHTSDKLDWSAFK